MFAAAYWGAGFYGVQHWPPVPDDQPATKRGAGVIVITGYDRVKPKDIDDELAEAFESVDDALEYLARRPRDTAKVARKVNAAVQRVNTQLPALNLKPFVAPDFRALAAARVRVNTLRATLQKEAVRRRREREAILVLML